jgi:hypothetical protein
MNTTTKKRKEIFLEVFRNNAVNISSACKKAGIYRNTFYLWCKKDSKFKEQVDDIKEELIDFAESQLMEKIKSGDTTSLIFFLKTKGKSRGYTEKQEITHSGDLDNQIHIYLPQKEG